MAFCVTLTPVGIDPKMLLPAFNTIIPDVLTGPLIVKSSPVIPPPDAPAVKTIVPLDIDCTPMEPMVNGLCAVI